MSKIEQVASFVLFQGMAVAARSQGKHKQRIWVNISMSGIKIIDEKSGVSNAVSLHYCHIPLWSPLDCICSANTVKP